MRGLKSTVALTVVLAGLLGYIYFVDAKKPAASESDKEKAFAAVEADRIEEVKIAPAGGEPARLVKGSNGWEIVEPAKADADASEISSITSNLSSLEVQRVVDENPGDLAQYGLNPPRVEISFRLAGEKDFRQLHLGEKTPTGGDLYAKRQNDKRVFLVSSFLDSTFNRTAFDLRNKAVLKFDREKADAVEVQNGGTTLQFVRNGTDWKMAKPFAARADYGAVEGLLTRLSSGQMQRIVDAEGTDLKKYGLDKPVVTAAVNSGSSRAALALGLSEGGATYAKDAARPMVFAVEDSFAGDLRKDVGEFRRKDVFDFRAFNAQRVQITRGAETLAFEKTKDKDGKEIWKNAAGTVVDTAKAEDLLTKLSNLRAQSFEASQNAVLKTPELTVTSTFENGRTETVQFARGGADVYAARSDEPGSAKLETTPYEDALKALDAVK